MTTTKNRKTIELTSGNKVEITVERGTWEEEIRLDGMLCGTKTHAVDRTEIILRDKTGKKLDGGTKVEPLPRQHKDLDKAIKAGCTVCIGRNWFPLPATLKQIEAALDELNTITPKTDEQIAIEAEQARVKAEADAWLNSREHREMIEFQRRMEDPNSDL